MAYEESKISIAFNNLVQKVEQRLNGMPDRGGQKYAELETIYAEKGGVASSFIDEGFVMFAVIREANEQYKNIRKGAEENLSMDPKDFNLMVKMRFNNDHVNETARLARALKAAMHVMEIDTEEAEDDLEVDDQGLRRVV